MIIKREEIKKIRDIHKDKVIVFCSGVFDLTHAGHALFFEDCKANEDRLVVSIGEDSHIRHYKGLGQPIRNHFIRAKMVDSLKSVDYCFINNPTQDLKNSF